jgi:hypothetical protein
MKKVIKVVVKDGADGTRVVETLIKDGKHYYLQVDYDAQITSAIDMYKPLSEADVEEWLNKN